MFATKTVKAIAGAAVLFTVGGCVDLHVTNPNEPERARALANPGDVESLIASQFRTYWQLAQGNGDVDGGAAAALDALAEMEASNSANDGTQEQGEIPPVPIPNVVGYRWSKFMRDPWLLQNRGLAAIREGLQAIDELGLRIEQGPRLQAFAKLLQGLFHGQIALLYDRGYIIDESVPDPAKLELQPYDQVMAAARGYLAEARSIAGANSFTIPDGWLGPRSYSNAHLVRLAHSYEARFMAWVARSPEERARVDWTEVLSHIENGVVEDFGVELDGPGGVWLSRYKARSGQGHEIYLPFIGPADQSGAYIRWEKTVPRERTPFDIDTDDRRITDGTPRGPGRFIVWRAFFNNQPERGTFFLSNYSGRWFTVIGETGFGFAPELTVKEMKFLAAEAQIRLGNRAAALPVINDERVNIGKLPPATLDGVSGDRCVPRAVGPLARASGLSEGACGDLWTTLIYEKRLQMVQLTAGSVYYDARGFGTLRTGRALQLPIPMEDLQLLGIPMYSFGGGGPGSAP